MLSCAYVYVCVCMCVCVCVYGVCVYSLNFQVFQIFNQCLSAKQFSQFTHMLTAHLVESSVFISAIALSLMRSQVCMCVFVFDTSYFTHHTHTSHITHHTHTHVLLSLSLTHTPTQLLFCADVQDTNTQMSVACILSIASVVSIEQTHVCCQSKDH